jgi:hypothetical protein
MGTPDVEAHRFAADRRELRNRRLASDFERYATTIAAFVHLAMIRPMLKRLTQAKPLITIPYFFLIITA